jgi:hypothetical protein
MHGQDRLKVQTYGFPKGLQNNVFSYIMTTFTESTIKIDKTQIQKSLIGTFVLSSAHVSIFLTYRTIHQKLQQIRIHLHV